MSAIEPRQALYFLSVMAILMGVIGLIVLFRNAMRMRDRNAHCTATAWGTVTEIRSVQKQDGTQYYRKVYEYETADGQKISAVSHISYSKELIKKDASAKPGTTVHILYDPEHPKTFRDPDTDEKAELLALAILTGIAGLFIISGVLVLCLPV